MPPALPLFPAGFPDIPGPGLLRLLRARALGCNGGIGETPLQVKLLPPGEIGMGASRASPSSPGGSDAAPHARHRAADSSPPNADTHFFMEDGLHVYLSGANGPRAEPTPSSSAPSPTPPPTMPRPASCHPRPRVSCRPITPENASHVDRRGVNAGAVNSGARDLCSASSHLLLSPRLEDDAAPPAVWRIISASHSLRWILRLQGDWIRTTRILCSFCFLFYLVLSFLSHLHTII